MILLYWMNFQHKHTKITMSPHPTNKSYIRGFFYFYLFIYLFLISGVDCVIVVVMPVMAGTELLLTFAGSGRYSKSHHRSN